MLAQQLERLAAFRIQILPLSEASAYCVLTRDGYAAMVERGPERLEQAGGAGLLTEGGLAMLVWRGGESYFVRQGFERKAAAEEVRALRAFATDVECALAQAGRPAPGTP